MNMVAERTPNPYAAQGSLSEAWQRGYEGRPLLAYPGSDYAKAYAEGKAARKSDDASGVPPSDLDTAKGPSGCVAGECGKEEKRG